MTKMVRIENADTSNYKVVVEIWDKALAPATSDTLVKTINLGHPTAMTGSDCYLTSSRYIIVKEAE